MKVSIMLASAFSASSTQNLKKSIHLDISLNEATYKAGGNLTGKVNLSVLGSDEVQLANTTIYLTIKGTEFAKHVVGCMNETTLDSFTNLKIPITTIVSGRIPPGRYEYPFQCTVPDNWPPSIHFRYNNFIYGIRYIMSVGIQHSYPQSNTLLDCLTTEGLVIAACAVAEKQLENESKFAIEPEFFPIQSCCSYIGSILLGFDISSTVMAPNTVVNIGILGKNSSVVEVQYLKAQLVQIVTHGQITVKVNVIVQTNIGASSAWDPLDISTFKNDDHRYSNPTFAEIKSSRVQGQLRVPHDAMESYQGKLIQIKHALVITAVTTGNLFVTSPQSTISVQVQQNAPLCQCIHT